MVKPKAQTSAKPSTAARSTSRSVTAYRRALDEELRKARHAFVDVSEALRLDVPVEQEDDDWLLLRCVVAARAIWEEQLAELERQLEFPFE